MTLISGSEFFLIKIPPMLRKQNANIGQYSAQIYIHTYTDYEHESRLFLNNREVSSSCKNQLFMHQIAGIFL